MLRFPCERYIHYLILEGEPNARIFRKLQKLGYRRKAFQEKSQSNPYGLLQDILFTIQDSRDMFSEIRLDRSGKIPDPILMELGLYSLYTIPSFRTDLEYLIYHAKIRENVELLLCGNVPEKEIRKLFFDKKGLDIPEEVLTLHRSMMFDLSILSEGEREFLPSLHHMGVRYLEAEAFGSRISKLLAGFDPGFDSGEDLLTVCSEVMARLLQSVHAGDGGATARWCFVLKDMYHLMGPALAFQELLKVLRETRIAASPLSSARLGPGLDVSGRTSGKVVVGEVQEIRARVQRTFNEYLQHIPMLQAPEPGEPT